MQPSRTDPAGRHIATVAVIWLFANRFGYRAGRSAIGCALAPDMNILGLRTITTRHNYYNILGSVRYRNDTLAGEIAMRPTFHPLIEGFLRQIFHTVGRPFPNKLLHVFFREDVVGNDFCVLRADHHYRLGT